MRRAPCLKNENRRLTIRSVITIQNKGEKAMPIDGSMKVWRLAAAGLLFVSVPACAMRLDVLTMRISYVPAPSNLPTIVLRRQGYLEKELGKLGWKVAWIAEPSADLPTAAALAAGDLDLAVLSSASLVFARARGHNIVALAPYSVAPAAVAVVAPVKGGVASIKTLAGKRVGLTAGTTAQYLLARTLAAEGISLAKAEMLDMTSAEAARALYGKKLDAAVLTEPVLSKAVADGKVRMLRDGRGLIEGMAVTAIRPRFLDNEEAIDRYKEAMAKAVEFIAKDPEAAVKLAAQETDVAPDLLRKIVAKHTYTGLSRAKMLLDLTTVAGFLAEQGMVARRMTLKELAGCDCE